MKYSSVVSALLAASMAPGMADAQPAPARTVLHLDATASIEVVPDQLVAALAAQSTSTSPLAAQRKVNELVAAGMRLAKQRPNLSARAVGYSVQSNDEKHASWTAQQTIELRGDGAEMSAPLLDLAGKLQQQGFAVTALEWQLSTELRRKAFDDATQAALRQLQHRAAEAAKTLGLRVDHLREVRLEGLPGQPRPLLPMAMAVREMQLPQATSTQQDVTATVSADVSLIEVATTDSSP